ncbi:TRAP transporter permease [Jannaschia marina]|uniref:TRAP transporter permease n=1 Tax=Jannaschia marina TaxID=2741674 RepID=UPI0015CE2540|nr:TRAP transporter fused permease subunit [Jannaschia marina]
MTQTIPQEAGDDLTAEELAAIEAEYDEVAAARPVTPNLGLLLKIVAVVFAVYHYLTAGFGLPVDYWHMGWHLSGLFVLIYAFYPIFRTRTSHDLRPGGLRPGNVPVWDWTLMALGIASALWLGLAWQGVPLLDVAEQALRQGNPNAWDLFFGGLLIVLVLDIARRTLGFVLPLIICVFIGYALFGPYIPVQILQHPGVDLRAFINNMYFPAEGIFGVTLWVVSTIVFHFVLFGVVAQRTGLGQLFIDNAMILAGKYTGGPAKVSVISSAFFGTISGSSVANTVSTGSLTIPNMKRLGYPGHFAGGVEAAASAGGQITPPIMGAAAFIMAEFLEVPYTTIVIAAVFPALLHYVGVFCVVHFMARRLGLSGADPSTLPLLKAVWKDGWANLIPLVGLLWVLFSGYTPYMAAFCGTSLLVCAGVARPRNPVSWLPAALFSAFVVWKYLNGSFLGDTATVLVLGAVLTLLNPQRPLTLGELIEATATGAKYALAVGAAAAAVGIVVGVINTTGVGFRVGFMVTNGATSIADAILPVVGLGMGFVEMADLTLFVSLVLIAMSCILMGAGIPTTALYIMLVSVAQPALAQLGVPPIASHMFVLYYGVVSEITPPVCTSAYAAAAIANSNPFRTGISAFTLGLGKIVAPMAFVYAPVLLLVPGTFELWPFVYTSLSAIAGVVCLSGAVVGFLLARADPVSRILLAVAGLVFIAPGLGADIVACLIAAPAFALQLLGRRRAAAA